MNQTFFLEKPLLKDIKPSGFYLRQLQYCASGLTGNIEKYFSDLGQNNAWKGGSGDAWERGPYYLDGLVSLTFLLKNDPLSAQMDAWIKPIINSSKPDGHFGPEQNFDVWPRLVALKALRTYHENRHDPESIRLIHDFIDGLPSVLNNNAPVLWAWARLPEIGAVLDLVDASDVRKRIYDKIATMSLDWSDYFYRFAYTRPTTHYLNKTAFNLVFPIMKILASKQTGSKPVSIEKADQFNRHPLVQHFLKTHGVNLAMALKYPVYEKFFGGEGLSNDDLFNGLDLLLRHHGNALGIFSSDEHLDGVGPRQGVELCAIVESMFSMEEILRLTGDPRAADFIELWAYNAWLSICTPDMTAHQYVTQPNQTKAGYKCGPFFDVGQSGTVFGLAPHFGCCAANMHQGWPKLVNAAVLFHKEEIFIFSYITGTYSIHTEKGSYEVVIEGDYPFGDHVIVTITTATEGPQIVHLRLPYGAETETEINQLKTSYINKRMIEIEFEGRLQAKLNFKFQFETHRHGTSISLRRGPLVYAWPIPSKERYLKGHRPFHDRAFIAMGPIKAPMLKLDSRNEIQVSKMGLLSSLQDRWPGARYLDVATNRGADVRLIPLGLTVLRISQFPLGKDK